MKKIIHISTFPNTFIQSITHAKSMEPLAPRPARQSCRHHPGWPVGMKLPKRSKTSNRTGSGGFFLVYNDDNII